ncbi:DUF5667 domain-containing protein [Candidatus Pyrohabitans sp.]
MRRMFMLVMTFMFLLPASALAQENISEEEAGIAPDSFLYLFDRLFEKLELALAVSEEAKVKVRLKHAEERLAEIKLMQKKNKTEVIVKLSEEYKEDIEEAEREIEEAEKKKKNVTEVKIKVVEATAKHLEVLQQVYELVPEEAKPAIEYALNVSRTGHEKIKMEFETDEGELEIKMGKEGLKVEFESKIPEEERAKAGKQRDGEAEESEIKAEVKGNITEIEVELPGVEYKFTLNTTLREEMVAEVANLTGLMPDEVAQLLEIEVEKEKPEIKLEEKVEEEESEIEIEIEVERKEEAEEKPESEIEKEEEEHREKPEVEEEARSEIPEVEVEIETGGAGAHGEGWGR